MSKDNYMDDSIQTFTLTDEDGNDYLFDLLGFVDYGDKLYSVLEPHDEDDDEGVVIMETSFNKNNEPLFTYVEDYDLAEEILNEYYDNLDREFVESNDEMYDEDDDDDDE